ncbi:SURF1 family cytochrome oxidase biogenesis protein [Erythrobacter sp. R86502]|uniref:SURF1 family cytochrome oxidase biogenesis protein n=1 Tax=Erythrobacter sp. R86502 TaxID=3093846 RepID=UPI0036D3FC94
MSRRVPVFATMIVIAAVLTMIALGFWQLGRRAEKAELLASYTAAAGESAVVPFPIGGDGAELWFRRSAVNCLGVSVIEPVAGTAASGQKGWVHRAGCRLSGNVIATVDLGFSRDLNKPAWSGGALTGVIAPGPRLVADPPVAGLKAMAKPDPGDLPNNHLAYAGQWFFFALTALVIYVLALRRRQR